jgi:branched-chain amino acid aminotransferase
MKAREVWVNGAFLPEGEAAISVRDLGLVYGDGVFDTARTFGGRLFRAADHVARLYESLAYVRIDPGISPQEMLEATEKLVARNAAALRPGEDWWVTQRVTAGLQRLDGEPPPRAGATVIIDCTPLPLRARARYFQTGIDAVVARRPKIAPAALSPRAKTNNYLNMTLAQREVEAEHPGAWALMRDIEGNLAEGAGCNFFAIKDGVVYTPSDRFVLAGISRAVVLEICAALNIPVQEGVVPDDLAFAADEAFFTSTSLCLCPLRQLGGHVFSSDRPVTRRITEAFKREVGFDFEAQYLAFASDAGGETGL